MGSESTLGIVTEATLKLELLLEFENYCIAAMPFRIIHDAVLAARHYVTLA